MVEAPLGAVVRGAVCLQFMRGGLIAAGGKVIATYLTAVDGAPAGALRVYCRRSTTDVRAHLPNTAIDQGNNCA